MRDGYLIRPLRPSERPFVLATFLNAWVKNNLANMRENRPRWNAVPPVYRVLPVDLLCEHYHAAMTRHLDDGLCLVAGDVEDDTVLLSYAVYSLDPDVLFWAYCKPALQGFGLEQALVAAAGFSSARPVLTPYRNRGLSRALAACGLRD